MDFRWLRGRRLWRPSVDREVEEELAFHLAMRAELLEASGMDPRTARDAALDRFGDVADVRARCITLGHERERRMKRIELWSAARQHTRFAVRRLRAAPGFTVAVLLMLALGIGATTAVFSVVDGVLLRPLPFPQPDRLVGLGHSVAVAGVSKIGQSEGTFLVYQRHATAFENLGAWQLRDVNLGALGDESTGPQRVSAAVVSAGLFPTLRVAPVLGRAIRPDDDRPGAPPVVVLSASLWRSRFGADRGIIGRPLVVDGRAREVVGVMPDDLRYPRATTALWLPLAIDPAHLQPLSFNLEAIGRLRPGITANAARADLARVLPRLFDEFQTGVPREMLEKAQLRPVVQPLRDVIVGDVGHLLWILLGAAALLLLVACANVASLFLVRAEGTHRELAVRIAIGAGRGAVLAQFLSEALLLALGGGALGVALAALAIRALRALPAGVDLPRLAEVGLDARVLALAVLGSIASAVAISLIPVVRARRITPAVVLKESSRSATTGRERQRARSALVVAQVAIALVLVAGSALMARSFARLRRVQPGFDPRGVLAMRIVLPNATYGDAGAALRFHESLLAEARALPGVRASAVGDWLPLTSDHSDGTIDIEDHPLPPDVVPPDFPITYVSAGWFATLGVPLLAGRTLGRADVQHPPREAVVSRSFAERYWKGQDAIGKRIRPALTKDWYTIVGVAGDVHMTSLEQPADAMIYFPLVTTDPDRADPVVPHAVAVVVRAGGDPTSLASSLRAVVHRLDPGLPTYDEQPMTRVLSSAVARTRFMMLTLGVASLVALVIGAIGLYGVLAYGVTLRRREIGVRIALGATAPEVSRMVARRGIVLAAIGVAIGLAAAMLVTRALHGLLYGVSPTDPLALAGTCAVLLAVAVVASWLPARRAAAVDPMEALRRD